MDKIINIDRLAEGEGPQDGEQWEIKQLLDFARLLNNKYAGSREMITSVTALRWSDWKLVSRQLAEWGWEILRDGELAQAPPDIAPAMAAIEDRERLAPAMAAIEAREAELALAGGLRP